MPRQRYLTFLVLVLSAVVTGVRVLVDDSNPLWIYSGRWNAISPSNPCPACQIQLDPERALNRTWHDTALVNTVQLSFPGVSIEVYAICPPPLDSGSTYHMNYTFTFDGAPDGNFDATTCSKATFNYLVYARKNLTMGQHVFALTNNELDSVANSSLLLLDYAIYDDGTAPTPLTPPTPPSSTGAHSSFPLPAVIAPAAAAAVLLLANICLFFYYRRHRRPAKEKRIDMTTGDAMLFISTKRSDDQQDFFPIDLPTASTSGFAPHFLATQPYLVGSS
jgi:hypothetical protein